MARRRTRRWRGLVPLAIRGLRAAAGLIASRVALTAAVVAALGWGLAIAVRGADAFRITQLAVPEQSGLAIREPLIGRSIWDVDLDRLAAELQQQQPSARIIRVLRCLPGTVRVEIVPRVPIAQVRVDSAAGGPGGRWFSVDAEGFVLADGAALPQERLVRLTGIDRNALRPGRLSTDARMGLALRVLAKVKRAPAVISRLVTELNVEEPERLLLVLDGDMEVRCGSEAELESHLERLRGALKALAHQPLDVGYIDVRFQEPVVGPRTPR